MGQGLPQLHTIVISDCESLAELFVLPPALRSISIASCPRFEFLWGKEDQLETSTSLEYCHDHASTSMMEESRSPVDHRPRPYLEDLDIYECGDLVMLPNLPSSLKHLSIHDCSKLCSVSGHLDGLQRLYIYGCSKLQSLNSIGDLPSVETLSLDYCPCLASLPGVLGTYSALQKLTIRHCPAIDLKPLYKRHQQRLHSLEYKDLSYAHSRIRGEGPKLRDPKSWKYAIPWC